MGPEIWFAAVAVFVTGGAVGTVGTLLAQWLVQRVDIGLPNGRHTAMAERDAVRAELTRLRHHVRNMEARLDFAEQLLDGALPLAPAPERLPVEELINEDEAPPSD
jgi:transposase